MKNTIVDMVEDYKTQIENEDVKLDSIQITNKHYIISLFKNPNWDFNRFQKSSIVYLLIKNKVKTLINQEFIIDDILIETDEENFIIYTLFLSDVLSDA